MQEKIMKDKSGVNRVFCLVKCDYSECYREFWKIKKNVVKRNFCNIECYGKSKRIKPKIELRQDGLCDFGCGNKGIYKLENGKTCCSKSWNSCPEIRNKNSSTNKGHVYWMERMENKESYIHPNKGKTYEEMFGIEKSKELKKKIGFAVTGSTGKASTPELEAKRLVNQKKAMKGNPKVGGYRKGSGRGKNGRYKGYWCDSSWELAYIIYNLDNNIKFERNKKKFPYKYNNMQHWYYPDFKENDYFVEVKGWITEQTKEKIKQFPYKLKVLYKNEMKDIIDYVVNKYGINYIRLYDGNENIIKKDKKTLKQINEEQKNKWREKQKDKIEIIKNSNIDFTKFGWVHKVSILTGIKWSKVNKFMKKYLPEILEKAFKKCSLKAMPE
jgi:hypothetical protein